MSEKGENIFVPGEPIITTSRELDPHAEKREGVESHLKEAILDVYAPRIAHEDNPLTGIEVPRTGIEAMVHDAHKRTTRVHELHAAHLEEYGN